MSGWEAKMQKGSNHSIINLLLHYVVQKVWMVRRKSKMVSTIDCLNEESLLLFCHKARGKILHKLSFPSWLKCLLAASRPHPSYLAFSAHFHIPWRYKLGESVYYYTDRQSLFLYENFPPKACFIYLKAFYFFSIEDAATKLLENKKRQKSLEDMEWILLESPKSPGKH